MKILPVVLCGGAGTRLWPMSRENFPKQLLALNGDQSLLQQTAARLQGLKSPRGEAAETAPRLLDYLESLRSP